MVDLVNIEDMRRRARRRLPRMVFDFLEGGAGSERGLRRNRDALDEILLNPQRLVAAENRDQSAQLFGKTYAMPLAIAPTGLNGVLWPDGDRALARAAARYDIPFCLSTASTSTIEDVARASDAEKWFQLYVMNRDQARDFVHRALNADYSTLILTVDVAVNGKRERDLRSGFKVPFKLSPPRLFLILQPTRAGAWRRSGMVCRNLPISSRRRRAMLPPNRRSWRGRWMRAMTGMLLRPA